MGRDHIDNEKKAIEQELNKKSVLLIFKLYFSSCIVAIKMTDIFVQKELER